MSMRSVKIGCGQGFYGDSLRPAIRALEIGGLDFMCFDALAELTLAILARDRASNPRLGYTKDLPSMMMTLAPLAKAKGTVLITNGGGLNPADAATAITSLAREQGLKGLRVAYASGDDVLSDLPEWQGQGVELQDYETGERFEDLTKKPVFANIYLGADCIQQSLELDPHIVITGRTTDTASYLAPAMSRLGIKSDDWDKIATAIVVGHLLECSGQASGGNFSGDWWNVEGLHDIGYPTAEIFEDGRVVISKPSGTGGRVSRDTLKEQILYEIHDPSCYITPDVVVDLTQVDLKDIGPNQVELSGIKGRPAPEKLKLIVGLWDGFIASGQLPFSWPFAFEKAQRAGAILSDRVSMENMEIEELLIEYAGVNTLGGPTAPLPEPNGLNEVTLRGAVRCADRKTATDFVKLFPPLALNSAPFVGGLRSTSHVGELLRQWSCLVPRHLMDGKIEVGVMES